MDNPNLNDALYFPDQPDADPITETLYKMRRAYVYTTLAGVRIYVPLGFQTDLLSAPRFMWTVVGMSPDGLYRTAAVIHDYLYSLQGALPGLIPAYTRQQCDDILLEIMERIKIPLVQRKAAFYAVRLFGGTHWNS